MQIFSAFQNRNYAIYAGGNGPSLIGTWVQRIGIGWLAWDLTGSGTWLGLIAVADLAPVLLFGPIAGAIADRAERLRILFIGQSLLALQAASLFLLTLTGHINIYILLGLVLFEGITVSFNQPARLAIIHSLVRPEDLPNAITFNAIIFNSARFIGPALAGVLILSHGVAMTFLANALSYSLFLFALTRLDLPRPDHDGQRGSRKKLTADIVDGMAYALRHPVIGAILLIFVAICLGSRGVAELLPGFADAVFQRGASGLAILSASIGAGAVLGGLLLTFWRDRSKAVRLILYTAIAGVAGTAAFAVLPHFWLAAICLGLSGAGMTTMSVTAQTTIQTIVDGAMRARVLSLYGMIIRSGPALGALAFGAAADFIGFRLPLLMGCGFAFLVWLGVFWRRRRLYNAYDKFGSGTK